MDLAFEVLLTKFSELERHMAQANTRATGTQLQQSSRPFSDEEEDRRGSSSSSSSGGLGYLSAMDAAAFSSSSSAGGTSRGGARSGVLLDLD